MRSYWFLRVGAALCFIGHGAFGFIMKSAWVPYFDVVGLPESWAWRLMPIIGAVDVTAGMAVLFAPRGIALAYMVVWATWTALLRPLAGESVFEMLERAGNYGVPLALVFLTGIPSSLRWLWRELEGPVDDETQRRSSATALKWTTAMLLLGHGALGLLVEKPMLSAHYASVGLPAATTPIAGAFEIALAAGVLMRPRLTLLMFVTVWKLATESLFVAAGEPIWEFVERSGSFAAPLALLFMRFPIEAPAPPQPFVRSTVS